MTTTTKEVDWFEDDGSVTTWCSLCEMWSTVDSNNEYGTCMCS